MSYCKHPKGDLLSFVLIRDLITFVSITLTTLSVYIVKKTRSITTGYTNLLILLLIDGVAFDIVLQLLADPAYLLPLNCIYRRDPLLKFVPLSAAASVGLAESLVAVSCPIYFALFIYRHQMITPPGSRYKFPIAAKIFFVSILFILYLSFGATHYMERLPARNYSYISHLADDWDPKVVDRMDCFNTEDLYPYYAIIVFGVIFALFFIILIARHTLHILSKVKHISIKTQHLHRILTKALIVQALIPLAIVIVPFGIALIINNIFSNHFPEVMSKWDVEPLDVMMLLFSFHSSTHSIAMILTTPAFRSQLSQVQSWKSFVTFIRNFKILPFGLKPALTTVVNQSQGTFTTMFNGK